MFKNLLNRLKPASSNAATSSDDTVSAEKLIAEGDRLEASGDLARAGELYREAVAAAPGYARTHLNLGVLLAAQGDSEGAVASYEAVLAIDPHHPFGNYNYGRLLYLRGDLTRALTLLREALEARPEFPQALVLLASVLDDLGETEEAVDVSLSALGLQPDNPGIWLNHGIMQRKLGRLDDAEEAVRRVLDIDPRDVNALGLLSYVLRDHGMATEALEPLRAAIASGPDNLALRSDELLLLNFEEGLAASDLFARHMEFGKRVEALAPARFDRYPGKQDAKRRIRVGYVSGDFRIHPVTLFMLPVLEHHDRAAFEIFCYSSGTKSDHMTARVRGLADHWLDAATMSDRELADAIHADAIDILVDLTGHSAHSRLAVFSQRPAPVQAAWLGYLNTTGLSAIDYRLVDHRTDPEGSSQPLHTEKLVMLPESQWCYRPMLDAGAPSAAPLEANGYVTFGSFNSALKISNAMCRRWGQLLSRVPGSRLRVADIDSERKMAAITAEIERAGVSADRIEFIARVDLDEYFGLFSDVDIALDTFPYGGGTTTFDALWMGVPVVTAMGSTPVSRSASSILAAFGLDDWVAPSVEDFVDVAVKRATDHQAIVALRRALRQRIVDSPLTDAARFVRDLETAYRHM